MNRFNLRKRPRLSYYEPDEPNLDEYVFCTECADFVFEYCSVHGPLLVIPDDKVPAKPNVPAIVPRAALTIPHVFLHLARSTIPGAGIGVFTTLTLPRGVRFGPYRGLRTDEINSMYCWQIYGNDNRASHAIDARDADRSNWMRYVNCSRHWCEQNLIAYQYRGQIYYRTTRIIPRFTELMVFYGSEFANLLGVDLKRYNSPSNFAEKLGTIKPKKPTPARERFIVPRSKKQNPLESKAELENLKRTLDTTVANNNKNPIYAEKHQDNKNLEDTYKPKEKDNFTKHGKNHNKRKKQIINNDNSATQLIDTADANVIKPNNIIHKTKQENVISPDLPKITYTSEKIALIKEKPHSKNLGEPITISAVRIGVHRFSVDNTVYCEICPYKTSSEKNLNLHLRAHAANKSFTCNVCQYKTISSVNLKTHLRIHTGEKPYACDYCKKAFSDKSDLHRHLRIHTGEKPYACDVCKKAFNQQWYLKTHLRIHTGEKPYACDVCKKAFNRQCYLKTHLRIHTGEKPYACDYCKKAFNQQCNLKTHLRIHTGEKPYACDYCKKAFSDKRNLQTHLKMHTGEKL